MTVTTCHPLKIAIECSSTNKRSKLKILQDWKMVKLAIILLSIHKISELKLIDRIVKRIQRMINKRRCNKITNKQLDKINKKINNKLIIVAAVPLQKIINHQELLLQSNKKLLHIIAMDKIMDTHIITTTINNNNK